MIRKTNLRQLIILLLLVSVSVMACKKKKDKENLFPTDNGGGSGGSGLTEVKALPFSDDFNATTTEYGVPSNWYEGIATGSKTDRGWGFRSSFGVNSTGCMAASSYGGANGTDNVYLLTGPFNFSNYTTINLGFDIKKAFAGPGVLTVEYSTNYSGSGNPEASGVTWTELSSVTSQLPTTANTSAPFTNVVADLSTIRDNKVYIAFHWKGGTAASSGTFNLDNFVLSNATITPSGCGTKAGLTTTNGYVTITPKTLPFSDNFAYGCAMADYSVPADNWAEAVVTGYRTNRGWSYRGASSFGADGNGCMSASTYVSASATLTGTNDDKDNAYLVVGPFNVTSAASRDITMKLKKANSNPGTLKLVYSTNYTGSGNPEAAGVTWTVIEDLSSVPNTSSFTSHTSAIGTSGANVTGSAVYFGLQFKDGTITSSQSYYINDFSIGN